LDDVTLYKDNIGITVDNVSMSSDYGKAPNNGNERCGARNYKMLLEDLATDCTFATVQLTVDPPTLAIKGSNAAIVGKQSVYLKSYLPNYDYIQSYSPITILIY
jgi:hypothetical protein